MKRSRRILTPALFALSLAALAQQSTPRATGSATDITGAEVQATIQKTASSAVSDKQLRVVSINGEYNVGVGVVHRAKPSGAQTGSSLEHSEITEVYHVISGNATLVTGGTLENGKPVSVDSAVVKVLNGPSTSGSGVRNGVSRQIGPGDIVVIPPNTAHWFSAIDTDQIVYLVIRIDPHKVLPAGYDGRQAAK